MLHVKRLRSCGLVLGMLSAAIASEFGIGRSKGAEPAAESKRAADSAEKPLAAHEAAKPGRAGGGSKVVVKFPASLKGFKGRLLGKISEVNAKGVVLASIQRVEKEVPSPFPGMTMTAEAEKGSPESWLLGKTVQLLCKNNSYKKNYKPGQVIFGEVEWSEKDKALVITGAQWQGLSR